MNNRSQNAQALTLRQAGDGSYGLFAAVVNALSQRPLTTIFRPLMACYIVMLVLLPSGSIVGINVKMLCFIVLLPVAAQVSFARRQITVQRLVSMLLVPAILLLWAGLSQLYGFDAVQGLAQFKDLMVTICTCWFASVLCDDTQSEVVFLLRWVVYAEVLASSLKIALLTYAFVRGIPVSVLIGIIHSIFGVQLMPFDFEMALGRIQFISDNLIPICVFAVLCCRTELSFRNGRALAMLFALILSDLFSFSRYLWVFTVAALVLGLLVGKKDRFQAILVTILAGVVVVSLPFLVVVVTLRFSSNVVTSSDADRIQQIAALRVFVADAPWFGQGLGSYTRRVIRSPESPYSYEAQLIALFGQIGIVGVAFLALLTTSYYRRLWRFHGRNGMRNCGLLLLLLGWFAGGFFNPSVISSAAAVSYIAIFAMAALHEDESATIATQKAYASLAV